MCASTASHKLKFREGGQLAKHARCAYAFLESHCFYSAAAILCSAFCRTPIYVYRAVYQAVYAY